ncbi:PREDICTED: uncharacterized protein LOC104805918 isoform X2 [Tarenaya hassleriana]|nr:PREDICTED: uncharacterized protein LOC104805918 isoform X2 [Tarenaya hassleriana]
MMYGGSSKLGRGGGRGGGGASAGGPLRGRSSFPLSNQRNHSAVGRMPSGGSASRQRSTTGAIEETFSLLPSKSPPAFGMIIRLAPDLVEEIRRVEVQGGIAKIKFDEFCNNTSGNIINVGGKEFKFTWSRELGDLCDIYEERQHSEDGDGVLIEAGCAWRKLNVQRTLDESTTNHMKMRSVEAEQRTKSRKAIVLDPGNPSLTKKLALAEANPWRMLNKQKKEPPPKRRKVDPAPVPMRGPKLAFKPGASIAAGKGRPSASPGPSPVNQSNASPSPYGIGNIAKSRTTTEDDPPVQTKGKENPIVSEKDSSTRTTDALGDTSGKKANNANKPIDLQTLAINFPKDAPMNLKALEKVVGDKIPNAAKKIEPILKKVANFQAPGRYFLKSGAYSDSYKKRSSGMGSSPADPQVLPIAECGHDQLPVSGVGNVGNFSVCEPSGQCQQDVVPAHPEGQSSSPENVDIERLSPRILGDEKSAENREGQVGSSSDSGSSDSENNSGSSSDSEASSNSKEGSDEDVDIMSDDDREPQHTTESELGLPASTFPCQTDGSGIVHNEPAEKQEGGGFNAVDIDRHESDAIDIKGHSFDEGHGSDCVRNFYPENNWITESSADLSPANEDGRNSGRGPFSSAHDKMRVCHNFIGRFDDTENLVKKGETSFDEEDSTYLKYEKDSPDLKGPISGYSQYKAYIQEYHDKYDSYRSLSEIIEKYR